MKKSIIVNICGIVFHIDEDAYELLNAYISELNKYFSAQPGDKEIVSDIEARIVELLQPKLSNNKQSITIADIEEIISILGKPEDIAGSDEKTSNSQNTKCSGNSDEKISRRLYRDPDNAIISGVSSGMGAYFNVDPLIFRILFIVLIFAWGIGFIIYPILWIAVPQAKTVSQRLEMKGEEITITNIEKKIREEYELVKTNFSNLNKKKTSYKISGFINEILVAFGKLLLIAVTIFKYLFASFLILTAMALIIGTIAGIFFSDFATSNGLVSNIGSVQEFLNYFIIPLHTDILLLLGMAIILIPCVGFIYWGLKILIRFHTQDKWLSVAMSIIWILCIISFVTILLLEVTRYKSESINTETASLTTPTKNILYLKLQNTENKITEYSHDNFYNSLFGAEMINDKNELFAPVEITFEKATNNVPEIKIIRKAYSSNYQEATKAQKSIKVKYSQIDTLLLLDPFYKLEGREKWNFQHCKLVFYIPESYSIRFDKNCTYFINNWNYYEYPEHNTWKVTNDGLELKK